MMMNRPIFHVEQPRHIATALKAGKFKPERIIGQLQFHVALVDARLHRIPMAPLGILVYTSRNEVAVCRALDVAGGSLAGSTFIHATLPIEKFAALPSSDDFAAALAWPSGSDTDERP